MATNLDVANGFLDQAKEAVRHRQYDKAKVYTDMAAVAVQSHMSQQVAKVAAKIDRLASVVK